MKYLSTYTRNGREYYRIRRQVKGKEVWVMQTPNKEKALQAYNECQKVDWDINKIREIGEKYKKKPNNPHQYITYNKDRQKISHTKMGKRKSKTLW